MAWRKQKMDLGTFGTLLSPLIVIIAYALMHVIYAKINISTSAALSFIVARETSGWVVIVITIIFTASALPFAFRMAMDRSNWALIVTSPFPIGKVVGVHLSVLALQSLLLPALLITPLFNLLALAGAPQFLFGYVHFLSFSLCASALAALLLLTAFEFIGPGKLKLIGRLAFLAIFSIFTTILLLRSNFTNISLGSLPKLFSESFIFSFASWAGKGFYGGITQVCVLLIAGVCVSLLASIYLQPKFLQTARLSSAPLFRSRGTDGLNFQISTSKRVFSKEWKLILRNPRNIAELARQIVIVGIVLALIFSEIQTSFIKALGPNILIICALVANDISWQIFEDAQPNLLFLSPLSAKIVMNYKFRAATLPIFGLLLILCVGLTYANFLFGLLTFFLGISAVLGTIFINAIVLRGRKHKTPPTKQGQALVLLQGVFMLSLASALFYLLR